MYENESILVRVKRTIYEVEKYSNAYNLSFETTWVINLESCSTGAFETDSKAGWERTLDTVASKINYIYETVGTGNI